MYVYIDASGSDFQRERLTFAAVCLPQEANRHLPGFFFELKKEVYGVSEAAEVEPDRAMEIKSQKILNRNTYTRALEEGNEEALKHVRLAEKVFEQLAASKEFKTVTIFAIVWPILDFEPYFPEGFLPNPIRYLLQRINRLMELEFPRRKATIFFDRGIMGDDRKLLFNFLNHWHAGLDSLQSYISPTPFFVDSSLTVGIELADLIAGCIRQCWENNLIPQYLRPAWDRLEERPLREVLCDPYLGSLKRYLNVILARVKNFKIGGLELYGLYAPQVESFRMAPEIEEEALTLEEEIEGEE